MDIEIYTDGSYSRHGGSFAWAINHNIFDCGFVHCTSPFYAELYAIYKAVQFINDQMIYCESLTIYSDCKGVVNKFNRHDFEPKNNRTIWQSLISQRDTLSIEWIKKDSHKLNSFCDDLCTSINKKSKELLRYKSSY